MNWKGCGRVRSLANFKVLYRISLGGTEENREKSVRIAGLRAEYMLNVEDCRKLSCIWQFLH
jgi:hypothetical protein